MTHPISAIRSALLLLLLFFPIALHAQELKLDKIEETTEIMYVKDQVLDANKQVCALIKVFLPVQGAEFVSVVKYEYRVNEYWVYVDQGRKVIRLQCPGFHTVDLYFGEQFPTGLKSKRIYRMDLTGYESAIGQSATPVREGNFVVFTLTPPNATVEVDGQPQPLPQDGKVRVYLRRGTHSYKVSAYGYATATGTVTMADEKKNLPVELTSVMATLTVSCATSGAAIYVNDERKDTGRWTGTLAAGTYHIEARLDGHRTGSQDITLSEQESRTVSLPALTPIMGSLQVDFNPIEAEIWIDNKKAGTSPDVFNLLVGRHSVEIRASGYDSKNLSVTIAEGETAQLSGSLTKKVVASSSSSSGSGGKINGHAYVDLDLSVKWATCNVGASSPGDYGNYYAWGETTTKSTYTEGNSKTYGNSSYNRDIGGDASLDAARANWGGTWRLPTEAEFQELIDNCTWKWTTQGGKNGYKVTSKKNGNSIFLPAARWRGRSSLNYAGEDGNYWSSSPDGSDSNYARYLYFNSSNHRTDWNGRYYGFSVRPVSE